VKAIILVGGEGTRMRPLTYTAPKQMLPVVGVSMLERVTAHLASHGVTEAVLSLGYLPDLFIAAFPSFEVAGVPVSYAVEPEPLDTAGAIRFAARHGHVDSTFVVVNADVITDFDISTLIDFHRTSDAEATIALHPVEDPSSFGVVPTDPDGRVIEFVEKPPRDSAPTNEINAGIYVMETTVLDRIKPDVRVSVERETFPALAADGTLYARSEESYWLDAGTPAAYLVAHADILSGRRAAPVEPPVVGGSWIHDDAEVDPDSTVIASSVDRGCRVGEGASIESSVLMPGASVEPGARVEGSILGPGAIVRSGAVLAATCVVGADEVVDADARLSGDVRLGGPR
jgi:mannose-1-phosphate guanylyltransferase